jgi:hypothetical protein
MAHPVCIRTPSAPHHSSRALSAMPEDISSKFGRLRIRAQRIHCFRLGAASRAMSILRAFSFRLLGCLVLAVAVAAASMGHMRARSHIVPNTLPAGPVLVTGDMTFAETSWFVPGLGGEFGLVQFSGSPYRAQSTDICLGIRIASVPLTIPWLVAVAALVLTGVVLLFRRVAYDGTN